MPDRRVSRGVDDVDNFGSDLNHNKQQSSIGTSFTMRCLAYSRQNTGITNEMALESYLYLSLRFLAWRETPFS